MCDPWQKIAFATVPDHDGLSSWNPHNKLFRYPHNDAPKPAVDDAERSEIEFRKCSFDPCIQQCSYQRREIDHDTTLARMMLKRRAITDVTGFVRP
jgi:hypothetical protein